MQHLDLNPSQISSDITAADLQSSSPMSFKSFFAQREDEIRIFLQWSEDSHLEDVWFTLSGFRTFLARLLADKSDPGYIKVKFNVEISTSLTHRVPALPGQELAGTRQATVTSSTILEDFRIDVEGETTDDTDRLLRKAIERAEETLTRLQ